MSTRKGRIVIEFDVSTVRYPGELVASLAEDMDKSGFTVQDLRDLKKVSNLTVSYEVEGM